MVGDQNSTWSIGLGRWFGVPVRMHMLFFVFAVMAFYFGWHASAGFVGSEYFLTAFVALGILFVSIFVHEIAHGFTATGFGGRVDSIEMFPWGGASEIELPSNKVQQFLVHVAGPATNLFVCLTCACILLFEPSFNNAAEWTTLFNPVQPVLLTGNIYANSIGLIFWVNWLVFLANMLPVSPFDGGKIVRSLIPLVWPNTSTDQVYLGSMIVSMMTSIGLCVLAWLTRESSVETLIPMWLVLLLLAIVVFFGARRQTQLDLRDLEELLEDESMTYGDQIFEAIENRAYDEFDEAEGEHKISDWLIQHKYDPQTGGFVDTPEDEEFVDEILAKINRVGIEGLSEYERFVLNRVSAHYRRRKSQTDLSSN